MICGIVLVVPRNTKEQHTTTNCSMNPLYHSVWQFLRTSSNFQWSSSIQRTGICIPDTTDHAIWSVPFDRRYDYMAWLLITNLSMSFQVPFPQGTVPTVPVLSPVHSALYWGPCRHGFGHQQSRPSREPATVPTILPEIALLRKEAFTWGKRKIRGE